MTFRELMPSFLTLCRISPSVLFMLLAHFNSFSQHQLSLSPGLEEGREKWFDAAIGIENSGIVNGQEYFMPFVSSTSFPFYQSRQAVPGDIVFSNQVYRDVPLSYDCYSDVVVLTLKRVNNFFELVQLDTGRITEFRVHGLLFRKLADTRTHKSPEGTGYYNVLFESPTIELIARRTKVRTINPSTGKIEYATSDRIYFKVNDRWALFSGKKSLSGLVKNKKDLQAFLRESRIDIGHASEDDLQKVVRHFDENPTLLIGL